MGMAVVALTDDQVKRVRAMKHHELVASAETQDLAVVVEASLRLHRATVFLNVILIALTIVLILLTAALVYTAEFSVPS
jgi:hypothetical protein